MKEIIQELFKDSQSWRLQMFIDKMDALQRDAVINEIGEFAKGSKYYAQEMLKVKNREEQPQDEREPNEKTGED